MEPRTMSAIIVGFVIGTAIVLKFLKRDEQSIWTLLVAIELGVWNILCYMEVK